MAVKTSCMPLFSLISDTMFSRCVEFHAWNSSEEPALMPVRPFSYSPMTYVFRVDHLGDPPNMPYSSCVSHLWENHSHHGALASIPCCIALRWMVHFTFILSLFVCFTQQRYNIAIAVFECFGNFLGETSYLKG